MKIQFHGGGMNGVEIDLPVKVSLVDTVPVIVASDDEPAAFEHYRLCGIFQGVASYHYVVEKVSQ